MLIFDCGLINISIHMFDPENHHMGTTYLLYGCMHEFLLLLVVL